MVRSDQLSNVCSLSDSPQPASVTPRLVNHGCQSTAPPGCRSTCIHHTCPPPQAHAAIASHTDGRHRVNDPHPRREQRAHVHGRRARWEFVRRLFITVARDALLAQAPEDASTQRCLFRPDLSPSVCVRVHPGGHRRGRFVRRVPRRRRLVAWRRPCTQCLKCNKHGLLDFADRSGLAKIPGAAAREKAAERKADEITKILMV